MDEVWRHLILLGPGNPYLGNYHIVTISHDSHLAEIHRFTSLQTRTTDIITYNTGEALQHPFCRERESVPEKRTGRGDVSAVKLD